MPTFEPSRRNRIAFWVWVAGGFVWIYASSHYSSELWSNYYPETAYRFTRSTSEGLDRLQTADRLAAVVKYLAVGSVGYGLLGLVLFRRRWRAVIFIAAFVILWCVLGTGPMP